MKFGSGRGLFSRSQPKESTPLTRASSGLDQFCSFLESRQDLSVLDMSGASQANITFITSFGHRMSSDDIVGTMLEHFGKDFLSSQQAASNSQRFLDSSLTFPDGTFDAILVWDALQFLAKPVLDQTVSQLLRILRPGGAMLVFFNANEKAVDIPVYSYRVHDRKNLTLLPRGGCPPQKPQYFNNRSLEKVFLNASSVKFFLTRDHLRELIVRK
jgi:SAM-dependent methyltransferase